MLIPTLALAALCFGQMSEQDLKHHDYVVVSIDLGRLDRVPRSRDLERLLTVEVLASRLEVDRVEPAFVVGVRVVVEGSR